MKPGDLLKRKHRCTVDSTAAVSADGYESSRAGELALFLNHYVSVNQMTGEEYKCAEIMWLKDKHVSTASYTVLRWSVKAGDLVKISKSGRWNLNHASQYTGIVVEAKNPR